MSKINKTTQKIKKKDIYTLLLFALYKLKEVPEYSALSELIYILDEDSLLKLCEYFGGSTITIPKVEELESIVYALLLYQYINIDGLPMDTALLKLSVEDIYLAQVKSTYVKLCEIIKKYNIQVEN